MILYCFVIICWWYFLLYWQVPHLNRTDYQLIDTTQVWFYVSFSCFLVIPRMTWSSQPMMLCLNRFVHYSTRIFYLIHIPIFENLQTNYLALFQYMLCVTICFKIVKGWKWIYQLPPVYKGRSGSKKHILHRPSSWVSIVTLIGTTDQRFKLGRTESRLKFQMFTAT